jgi:hypothetical protein
VEPEPQAVPPREEGREDEEKGGERPEAPVADGHEPEEGHRHRPEAQRSEDTRRADRVDEDEARDEAAQRAPGDVRGLEDADPAAARDRIGLGGPLDQRKTARGRRIEEIRRAATSVPIPRPRR